MNGVASVCRNRPADHLALGIQEQDTRLRIPVIPRQRQDVVGIGIKVHDRIGALIAGGEGSGLTVPVRHLEALDPLQSSRRLGAGFRLGLGRGLGYGLSCGLGHGLGHGLGRGLGCGLSCGFGRGLGCGLGCGLSRGLGRCLKHQAEVIIEEVGACLGNQSVGHLGRNIPVALEGEAGSGNEVNTAVGIPDQTARIRLAVLQEADVSVREVVQSIRQLADMDAVLVKLMVLIGLRVADLRARESLVDNMVRESREAVQLTADGIPSGSVLLAANPDQAGAVVVLDPRALKQLEVHKPVSDTLDGLRAVHGGTGGRIEVVVGCRGGGVPALDGVAVQRAVQPLADPVQTGILLERNPDSALGADQLAGLRIQLVAMPVGAGRVGAGVGIQLNRSAVGAHTVSGNGQAVLVRLDSQEQRIILLRNKREVERRVVHGSVVQVPALLAQVAADVVHGAVLVHLTARHRLRAGVGMVVTGEDNINPGGIDRGGHNGIEAGTSAALIGEVGRLMDRQDLPRGVARPGVLDQPCQRRFPVGGEVDDRNVHIAVLGRIVVASLHVQQDVGGGAGRVSVVLVVSVGVDHVDAVELIAKDILDLFPHRVVTAVVHIVTGLDAELGAGRQVGGNGSQQCDGPLVGGIVPVHLGIAHHEEVGLKGLSAGPEGSGRRPVLIGAVTHAVDVSLAGFQPGQRDGVQECGVFGGQEGVQLALADCLAPCGSARRELLREHILHDGAVRGDGCVCHPCEHLFVCRIGGNGGHERRRRAVGRTGDRIDHHRGGKGDQLTLAGSDQEGGVAFHGSGGSDDQLAVLVGNADNGTVDQHFRPGNPVALGVGHDGKGVEAGKHHADLDGVVSAQAQLHLGIGGGGGLARVVDAVDLCHLVGEEINLGIQRCGNREGQGSGIGIGRRRALADPVRAELDLGSLEAGGRVDHLALPAVGKGNGGLTEVGVDLQECHIEGFDRAACPGSQRVGQTHGDGRITQKQGGARHGTGVLHEEVAQHAAGVAEAVPDRHLHTVDAVGKLQAGGHGCRVTVALDFLAVDKDGGQLRADAGGVLAVHIVEQRGQVDGGVVDGHDGLGRESRAVDGDAVHDRVVQVVKVGAVHEPVVVEVQRTGIATGAVGLTGLVAQPEQTAAGDNRNRMLRGCVGCNGGHIGVAVHPALPVDVGAGAVAVLELEVLGRVVGAVPDLDVGIQEVPVRAAVGIHPHTQLGRRAVDVDGILAAVADVEVGVGCPVIGRVVVVELQRVLAEADLTALGGSRCRHAAGVLGRDGVIGPEVEGIPVGAENIRCGNAAVPVSGEGERRVQLGLLRVVGIPSVRPCVDGRHVARILAVARLTPVVVRTGQSAVLVRLEVHNGHGHLTDLHADGGGQDFPGRLGVAGGHGSPQRGGAGSGDEVSAVHMSQRVIRDALDRGADRPLEFPAAVLQRASVRADVEAQRAGFAEVQVGGLSLKVNLCRLLDIHGRGADHSRAVQQVDTNRAGTAVGNEPAVRGDVTQRKAGGIQCEHHALGDIGRCRVTRRIDRLESKVHRRAGRVGIVIGSHDHVVKAAVGGGSRDQQDTGGDGTLRAVGGAVADDLRAVALALGHEGSGSAAVQIQRLNDTLRDQEVSLLGLRHTHREGILTSVRQEEHDGAVRLASDRVDRIGGAHLVGCHVLAVPDEEEGTGNRLCHIIQRCARIAENAAAVLQNGEVRLSRCLLLVPGNAVHDQRAGGLTGLHIEIVTVGGENNILAGGFLIVGSLLAGVDQRPIIDRPLCGIGSLIVVAVGCFQLEIGVGGEVNGQHIAHCLLIACRTVQCDVRLGHALGDCVIRRRDDILGLTGMCIHISVQAGRGKCRCRNKSEHEGERNENADELCKACFHVFFVSFPKILGFVSGLNRRCRSCGGLVCGASSVARTGRSRDTVCCQPDVRSFPQFARSLHSGQVQWRMVTTILQEGHVFVKGVSPTFHKRMGVGVGG